MPLADREVEGPDGHSWRTAARALPGAGELGGAEDGRTALFAIGVREGQRGTRRHGERDRGHGVKLGALDPSFDLGPTIGTWLEAIGPTTLAVGADAVPGEAPISVVRIGASVFAGVPFEPTTVVGLRFERALAHATGVDLDKAHLIGLTGEYIGYLTTPEEYEAQHYEGASTLYGGASAPLVGSELVRLATAKTPPPIPRKRCYDPSPNREFGPHVLGEPPLNDTDGLSTIVVDLTSGKPIVDPIRFTYISRLPDRAAFSRGEGPLLPRLEVGRIVDGVFQPLHAERPAENEATGRLVTVLLEACDDLGRWATVWMPAAGTKVPIELRLHVRHVDGSTSLVPPSADP